MLFHRTCLKCGQGIKRSSEEGVTTSKTYKKVSITLLYRFNFRFCVKYKERLKGRDRETEGERRSGFVITRTFGNPPSTLVFSFVVRLCSLILGSPSLYVFLYFPYDSSLWSVSLFTFFLLLLLSFFVFVIFCFPLPLAPLL